jgi:hypothetical protein
LNDQWAREAIAALQRGDGATARQRVDALRRATNPATPWLIIGQVEQALGDTPGASDAFERQLQVTPRDLPTLLVTAALKEQLGDERGALTFYRAALNVAAQPGFNAPPALSQRLHAAQAFIAAASERFAAHLDQAISDNGLATGPGGTRLREALDLLMGRYELYAQQPSMFYFPGLAQRAFFEREEFDWIPSVEAMVSQMQRELAAMMATSGSFSPYVQTQNGSPPPANPLLDDPSWSALYLWQGGAPVEPNASRCPATMQALAHAPLPIIAKRSPLALFSLLRPGTHIRPHHGLLNTRLICHVPLIAPPDCTLRVGAHRRTWEEGRTLIFDDSIEHEAWNNGNATRVVLLFEIWRPDISIEERAALTDIFTAIDDYQGSAVDNG